MTTPDPYAASPADRPGRSPSVAALDPGAAEIVHLLGGGAVAETVSPSPDVLIGPAALVGQIRGPTVVEFDPATVEDVLDAVFRIGAAIGRSEAAMTAVVALRERLFSAAEFVNPFDEGPSVAVLEALTPLRVAGLWTPQLVERAGGRHPLNPTAPRHGTGAAIGPQMAERIAGPAREVAPSELAASEPAWILISIPGVGAREAAEAARRAGDRLAGTPAWREGRVVAVDGRRGLATPGPGLVEAFEHLVSLLNDRPEISPPGLEAVRLTP